MGTHGIRIVLWVWASILITLGVSGFATRADLQPSSSVENPPRPSLTTAPPESSQSPPPTPVAVIAATPIDPLFAKSAGTSPLSRNLPTRPQQAPVQPALESPSKGLTADPKCPLSRVALVRGSDSEAREGGGFYAARKNGIHGAVDLNGSLGEAVFAVARGKVITAGAWGKLGNTVIVDHLDGGYTIYGHLDTVDAKLNSTVTVGQMLGTIGYSGNARALRAKNLPPHLHFAYYRELSPLSRLSDSADGVWATEVLDPMWAVRFHKCWEEPILAKRSGVTALSE